MSSENISYEIKDNTIIDNPDLLDVDEYNTQFMSNIDMDIVLANQINYQENYTVKELNLIMDYYKLKRRKLKKSDLVEKISLFESEPENIEIFQERIRLWQNFYELQEIIVQQYLLEKEI